MRVEVHEYGDDPESDYPEDFNSFKVMSVWSEPDRSDSETRRLITAVEFSIHKGGYFYIEKPNPNPEWLEKVFELLKEEGWQGYSFEEIRGNCRGDIEIQKGENYTAVIDRKKGDVLHNRNCNPGGWRKTSVSEWTR